MYALSDADKVWNRAAMEAGGSEPRSGDRALADLLLFHSLAMNGGVLQALEELSAENVKDAIQGFRYFELHGVAVVVADAAARREHSGSSLAELATLERGFDHAHSTVVPDDATIVRKFEVLYARQAADFAPCNAAAARRRGPTGEAPASEDGCSWPCGALFAMRGRPQTSRRQ